MSILRLRLIPPQVPTRSIVGPGIFATESSHTHVVLNPKGRGIVGFRYDMVEVLRRSGNIYLASITILLPSHHDPDLEMPQPSYPHSDQPRGSQRCENAPPSM